MFAHRASIRVKQCLLLVSLLREARPSERGFQSEQFTFVRDLPDSVTQRADTVKTNLFRLSRLLEGSL